MNCFYFEFLHYNMPFTLQFGNEEGNFAMHAYYSERVINIDSVKCKAFGPNLLFQNTLIIISISS